MTLTIGRASLPDPTDVTIDGDDVTFKVHLGATSVTQMKALRQQVAGIANNPDEDVVPVTSSLDSTLDGFYRVTGVSIPSHAVTYVSGFVPPVSIGLRRVGGGYSNPTFECVRATPVTRTNAHSFTASSLLVVPGDGTTYTFDAPDYSFAAFGTRPSADGVTLAVASSSYDWFRFDVAPSDYYKACCKIEVEYGGTWYPVVGQQIPKSTRFRIGNELVRFTSGDATDEATFEMWNGSSWSSFEVSFYDSGSNKRRIGRYTPGMDGWSTTARDIPVTIVRNGPEQAAVRMSTWDDQVTFSVGRGDLHLTMHWSTRGSDWVGNVSYGLAMTTNTAGTSRTGGIEINAGTYRPLFIMAEARTADTANGRIRASSGASSGTLFIGALIGASPGTFGTYSALSNQMVAGTSWRQRVVPR